MALSWQVWKQDWGQEEKGATEDEMVGWHHGINKHEFEQTRGDSERQGSPVCCSSWGYRVRHNLANEQQQNTVPGMQQVWTKCLLWTNESHKIKSYRLTSIIWHVPQQHLRPSRWAQEAVLLPSQTRPVRQAEEKRCKWFKSWDLLVPELEQVLLVHRALPYTHLQASLSLSLVIQR